MKTSILLITIHFFLSTIICIAGETQSASGGGGSSRSNRNNSYRSPCYPFVKDIVQEDKQNSSLGLIKSMHATCRQGAPAEMMTQNFSDSKSFGQFLGSTRYSHLGSSNQFDFSRCVEEKDVPVHELASKYYYMMNRISLGQESSTGRIAAIGRILGDQSVLARTDCAKSDFQNVKKICEEAAKCSSLDKSLDKMVESTNETLAQIASFENEIKELEASKVKRGANIEARKNAEVEIMMRKSLIETLRSFIPWVNGKEYKNAIKLKRPVKDAIVEQLKDERKGLVSQYALLEKHKRCLVHGSMRGTSCSSDDIVELAENTPDPGSVWEFSKDSRLKSKYMYANQEIDAQNCIFNGKVDQLKTSTTINSAAIQAGLTVATVGLGSAAVLGRVLTSRALMAENTVSNLVKGANVTRVGVDGGMFIKDAKEAYATCDKFAKETPNPSKADTCQVSSTYESTPQIDAYKDCLIAIAFAGADGGRLALGKLVSKLADKRVAQLNAKTQERLAAFLEAQQRGGKFSTLDKASEMDNLARFKAAETLLGRELTLEQKQAILKAHQVGGSKGFFEYSKDELREKMNILKSVGLEGKDADLLMRTGITGQFAGNSAELAKQGLLDAQLLERNSSETLSGYYEDRRYVAAKGADEDKLRNQYRSDLDRLARERNDKNLTDEARKKIDDQIAAIEKRRDELGARTFGKGETADESIQRTRSDIAKKTDDIDRIRAERYGDSTPLDTPNNYLNQRLQDRQKLFESEGAQVLQRNGGDPSEAIAPFRRAVKDMNERQNMGFVPKNAGEAESSINLRAIAQDYKGLTGREMEALIEARAGAIEVGKPLLRAEVKLPVTGVATDGKKMNEGVWNAYVNYSQRVADQQVVSFAAENNGIIKKFGLDKKALQKAEDLYVAAREEAYERLAKEVKAMYKSDPKKAEKVLKALSDK